MCEHRLIHKKNVFRRFLKLKSSQNVNYWVVIIKKKNKQTNEILKFVPLQNLMFVNTYFENELFPCSELVKLLRLALPSQPHHRLEAYFICT